MKINVMKDLLDFLIDNGIDESAGKDLIFNHLDDGFKNNELMLNYLKRIFENYDMENAQNIICVLNNKDICRKRYTSEAINLADLFLNLSSDSDKSDLFFSMVTNAKFNSMLPIEEHVNLIKYLNTCIHTEYAYHIAEKCIITNKTDKSKGFATVKRDFDELKSIIVKALTHHYIPQIQNIIEKYSHLNTDKLIELMDECVKKYHCCFTKNFKITIEKDGLKKAREYLTNALENGDIKDDCDIISSMILNDEEPSMGSRK